MPYKLSATLTGHTSDVRALATPTNDLILSASRDTTAISWSRSPSDIQFKQSLTFRPGPRFVNAITYIPPSPDAPEGYAVTGGQDAIINVFSLSSKREDSNVQLIGHTNNVCALYALHDGTIISGSWDQTARVWKKFQFAYELVGHAQSVWAVVAIDSDQFLTGSADNTIKLWHQHKNIQTYTGHTQAVRGLALVPDIGFASCSNDSEVRVWTLGGDLIYTLSGHTSFVYSITVLPNGDIASSGEDRTLRVWKDGECAQTIVHPAISVWTVSALPNGDIATGASDGIVRVFSAAEERWAPEDQLKAYDDQVSSSALPAEQVGDINKSDLPGPEVLTAPGLKSGEVKMVRKGATVEAHQWDSASMSWQKIGEVVDAVGSGRKQLYNGKEYDYVFDVDVEEGAPPLKLPYDVHENPYTAAQRFLQTNDLPLSYLDEVVRFIEKNTAGVKIGSSSEYQDPFTGASRYQPAQSQASNSGSEFMDPFTGASRYRAQPSSTPSPAPAPVASTGGDPWTGASRYSGSTAPPPSSAASRSVAPMSTASSTIPVRTPLLFRQANVAAMRGKFMQFDADLTNEISTSGLAMYHQEPVYIEETFTYLTQAVANISPITAPKLNAKHIDTIISIVERWPSGSRFPVIDLARLVVGYCSDTFPEPEKKQKFFSTLFDAAEWTSRWVVPVSKSRETNGLLLLRGVANAFKEDTELEDSIWAKNILEKLGEAPYTVLSKPQRVALATILFNLSTIGLKQRLEPSLHALLVTLVLQTLQSEKNDSEAAYRGLVALGNIAYAAKEQSSPLEDWQVDTAKESIAALPSLFPEERVKSVAGQVTSLL
ncbi:phospholipase A-2-activating protein [Irpex rosettiformis]|uniref:Phospholipase A-2-activating protein n=1 Tax=Irpex rosettiformis TaxID=378272 RepID=A0ACB8TWI6_9APHY|nr:phospholipase A-2-activating protein [Irpex rosettiformis]